MNFKRIATGALAGTVASLLLASSAFAANTITVSGNGASSTNTVGVNNSSNCTVVQSNKAFVGTHASSSAKTGKNKANKNTGGSVTVTSGVATSGATVAVTGNGNVITTPPCCECNPTPDTTVDVIGNGAGSTNTVGVTNGGSTTIVQSNDSTVFTGASSKASTGGNKANGNTGPGDVSVTSGDATSTTSVTVNVGANSL